MNRSLHFPCSFCEAISRQTQSKQLGRSAPLLIVPKRRCGLRGFTKREAQRINVRNQMLPEEKIDLPTQGQSAVAGVQLEDKPDPKQKGSSEVDYLTVQSIPLTQCADSHEGVAAHSAEWTKGYRVLWDEEHGGNSPAACRNP